MSSGDAVDSFGSNRNGSRGGGSNRISWDLPFAASLAGGVAAEASRLGGGGSNLARKASCFSLGGGGGSNRPFRGGGLIRGSRGMDAMDLMSCFPCGWRLYLVAWGR